MGLFGSSKNEKVKKERPKMQPMMFIDYIGGYPKLKRSGKIIIQKCEEPHHIKLNEFEINVTNIEFNEKGKRNVGKAAAGAIIGGVLTGGIGTIAGAAIGGRKHDNSTAVITTDDGYNIYVRCDQNKFAKLTSFL